MSILETRIQNPVHGVCPVLQTPFLDDGSVDLEGFRRVVRQAIAAGVSSVMYPGIASEYYKLTDEERDALIEALFQELSAAPGVGAVVAIQDHSTRIASSRAREVVEKGALAVNILPPFIFGPSPRSVASHVDAVLSAIAPAPGIVQYVPALTGTALDAEGITRLASDHPNLVGVKVETRPSGPFIAALLAGTPPLPSIEGYGGVMLPDALERDAVAVQPGCSFTEIYVEIWRRHESGDVLGARELHTRLLPYLSYWMSTGELIVSAEKMISFRRGLIATPYCRQPAPVLDEVETAAVDRFLTEFAEFLPRLDHLA